MPEERHRPSTSTKLYCLVTEAHGCEQLAQGCYAALSQWELNPSATLYRYATDVFRTNEFVFDKFV